MKKESRVDTIQSTSEKKPVIATTNSSNTDTPCANTATVAATAASTTHASKPTEHHQPQIIKYQTQIYDKKDCFLRILYPNGDRLDFTTNGDSNLKVI